MAQQLETLSAQVWRLRAQGVPSASSKVKGLQSLVVLTRSSPRALMASSAEAASAVTCFAKNAAIPVSELRIACFMAVPRCQLLRLPVMFSRDGATVALGFAIL